MKTLVLFLLVVANACAQEEPAGGFIVVDKSSTGATLQFARTEGEGVVLIFDGEGQGLGTKQLELLQLESYEPLTNQKKAIVRVDSVLSVQTGQFKATNFEMKVTSDGENNYQIKVREPDQELPSELNESKKIVLGRSIFHCPNVNIFFETREACEQAGPCERCVEKRIRGSIQ